MATDLPISKLTGKTTVTTGALITGVTANGGNFKMPIEDFIQNVLGSTGSLANLGTGTDILNTVGLVNNIRRIAAGQGISVSIDPTQALAIASALTSGSLGTPVLDISNDIVKSLTAGAGIELSAGAASIQITATGITAPTNVITINQESDFPIQDAGTITLGAGIIHVIGASFSTSKRFIVGNGSLITMNNVIGTTLTYTGTGVMFTGVDVSFTLALGLLSCPNAVEVFNFTDTVGNVVVLNINRFDFGSCQGIGTFDGGLALLMDTLGSAPTVSGIKIVNSPTGVLINRFQLLSSAANIIGVDLGSSIVPALQIINSGFSGGAGSFMISGLTASGNVPVGQLANIGSNSTAGAMVPLQNISVDDIRWVFRANTDIPDTRTDGLLSLSSNATETVISTQSVAVLVLGTWVVEAVSQMTGTTGGRLTYDLEKDSRLPIDISASLMMASGGNVQVKAYLALNGSVIAAAAVEATSSSSTTATLKVPWQLNLSDGDFLEVFVSNEGSTVNIIVSDAILRVN